MEPPQKLTANTAAAQWLNQLLDFVLSTRTMDSGDIQPDRKPFGTELRLRGGALGSENKSPIRAFVIADVSYAGHLVCHAIGTEEGDFSVAKPRWIRGVQDSRYHALDTASATNVTYSTNYQVRKFWGGGGTKIITGHHYEELMPRYKVGDRILAFEHPNFETLLDHNSSPIFLWDLNIDARRWTYHPIQTDVCINNEDAAVDAQRSQVEPDEAAKDLDVLEGTVT